MTGRLGLSSPPATRLPTSPSLGAAGRLTRLARTQQHQNTIPPAHPPHAKRDPRLGLHRTIEGLACCQLYHTANRHVSRVYQHQIQPLVPKPVIAVAARHGYHQPGCHHTNAGAETAPPPSLSGTSLSTHSQPSPSAPPPAPTLTSVSSPLAKRT
jgi:hypothetical protein